mmetsp:Transcript_28737/g.27707  ORF Transcript_28737/g.27707 Transcript_28737/m.27707 type:complete len:117 (+) Transcript_28737:686-1036(+)|eukprot:CAMPEP_0170557238 /NCGR_PEP_ID=MMETSP0211-20121228/21138_1 /TAXON_ID=311385 /ORGANISM="Pseudokeronopsis sp., Strain OXSARD2" /LENGTH=116 /DNA_ID=CAMNT_0010868057 /DNA_START=636 /DNA_END=986 /DNA_ORIENTATION=+
MSKTLSQSALLGKPKEAKAINLPVVQEDRSQFEVESKQVEEEEKDPNEEEERKSELLDEINSLYNMDNPKGDDIKSTVSSKGNKSTVSKKSQVIITNLEKQLEEERSARRKLEEEL